MTPLFLLNYVILQWFFIRLAKVVDKGTTVDWCFIKVWPLSGFHGRPYRYWGRT